MDNLESIIEMRKTLVSMNDRLTPYSGKVEHQRYLDSLKHYKKILNSYISRLTNEIDQAINKSISNIDKFTKIDNNIITKQVLDGRQ